MRHATSLAIIAIALSIISSNAGAQYFGRNKVQYENFDFKVLKTEHFDIHYYPEEEAAVRDAARMAERWYTRHARVFNHQFTSRKPIILYADQGDFQQTNTITSMVGEGTGGVTEALKNRVILPFNGSLRDFDHVLGHELVHAFQYDIAGDPRGNGLESLGRLPLWFIEGLAEYLSLGREDAHTALWLRDAVLRDDIPTIEELAGNFRYFPYRYGQAVWAYIAGTYGDEKIAELYRKALDVGLPAAFKSVLGVEDSTLSKDWKAALIAQYRPLITDRAKPSDIGRTVIAGDGDLNVAPVVSPDGKRIAFFSSRGIFSIDLYIANARTGAIERRLAAAGNGPHSDALRFINSAGTWSPDGKRFAYVLFAEGDDQLSIAAIEGGDNSDLRIAGVGAITNPAWSPDGRSIAFSGTSGGVSDLYLVDIATSSVRRLTNDKFTDLQPAWSPDSRTIAFVSDRGTSTSFTQHSYAELAMATIDVASGAIAPIEVFANARHTNPQYSPDGRDLYFISNVGGFTEIYRTTLGTSNVYRVTRVASGVSGITATSPAMSVAQSDGSVYFSVFDNNTYSINALDSVAARGEPFSVADASASVAGVLPPADARGKGVVASNLNDPLTGLPAPTVYPVSDYVPSLHLDYLGTPTVGVSVDSYGAGFGGGIAGYFSDMLGNHNVGATLNIAGSIENIGGQVQYVNRSNRWNWGVSAGHTPYVSGSSRIVGIDTTIQGEPVTAIARELFLERTSVEAVEAAVIYPFSITHRFEAGLGYTHIGSSLTLEREIFLDGQLIGLTEADFDGPQAVNLIQPQVAFVGDYSFFGYTSPVAGARYRAELGATFGSLTFGTLLLDYRHYFFANPVTLALRGLGYGRFGNRDQIESDRLSALFIGREGFIRGYSVADFSIDECTGEGAGPCPEFDRLVGTRMAIANAEIRVPVLGTDDLGLITFPYLPLEITGFVDAGTAWTDSDPTVWSFERNTTARVPVVSAGASARLNLMGYLVIEMFYVYPFQRPERGWHFGWQIAPGW